MMEKKKVDRVLVILASPRKNGNSTVLAGQIAKGAEAAGAAVETVSLRKLDIKCCLGCYSCQKEDTKGCAIDDDMQSLYPKLLEAQAWVFASPVYWFNMSAQFKLFLDRVFALSAYARNPYAGRRVAVAMAYADADPFISGCANALRIFQDSCNYMKADLVGMVYGSAWLAGEMQTKTDLLEKAYELGKKLVKD